MNDASIGNLTFYNGWMMHQSGILPFIMDERPDLILYSKKRYNNGQSLSKIMKMINKWYTQFYLYTLSYTLCMLIDGLITVNIYQWHDLDVVPEWSKVLSAVPWPYMVWSTLALGTYQLRFVSWVFHVIFSFVHFISLYTLVGLRAYRKPLPYNMYVFNLQIANHILIIID